MLELSENTCCGLNLWQILKHNEWYFHSGNRWAKHESGKVWSVTIPVEPGTQIYATSFGKYGENGNTVSNANGIRVTFFDAYGVVKTMDPASTYAEFISNGGYLIAPEGSIAVNIPMWNNSDDNEIYILNREHIYENGTCLGCQEHIGPLITKQPVSCEVALGERFTFTVEAEGEGLSYQWYYKDSYMKEFRISSFKSSTYAMTMANYHNNRQVYCVITDMNGNSVQTEVATIYLET